MGLVLDAGALVAIDRGDRERMSLLKDELRSRRVPRTHGGVIGQVWRDGSKQARLAKLLGHIEIANLDEDLGRRVGALLGRTRTADVIDAAVVLLARNGDMILTSDPDDLTRLAQAAGLDVEIVPV